jgi:hypothetical protein
MEPNTVLLKMTLNKLKNRLIEPILKRKMLAKDYINPVTSVFLLSKK